MLWGGLQPIPRQVALDAMTLLGWVWSVKILACSKGGGDIHDRQTATNDSTKLLLASCALTLATSGVSNRWPLTLPMLPLLVLHFLHQQWLYPIRESPVCDAGGSDETTEQPPPVPSRSRRRRRWLLRVLTALSLMCIAVGAVLSVLFPALQLPPISGPYQVGTIEFYIPLEIQVDGSRRNLTGIETEGEEPSTCPAATTTVKQYLPARLFYPTLKDQGTVVGNVPYLNPDTAIDFCRQFMQFGAPAPLKSFGWILHTWRLTTLPVFPEAPVRPGGERMPLVVYSHGLGGTLDVYSYQAMSLAAHGSVALVLTHMDGTAPVVPQPRGTAALQHNTEIRKLFRQGQTVAYARARRVQTEQRVQEFLGATDFLHRMVDFQDDDGDETQLEYLQLSRRLRPVLKRWQTNHTFFMGHSLGGATVLTAALRRPELVKAVIAHEPAIDWAPDDCRRSLFAKERLEGLELAYDGGTGGFETELPDGQANANAIHDLDLLVLNSHEWMVKDWGSSALLDELHRNVRLGKTNGISSHGVVKDSTHTEFSDTCMLTPLWLARPVGLTGPRNPIDTALEIAERTRSFLEEARRH
jgi:pimeloyl-ACP methyl ester carboxylesterase